MFRSRSLGLLLILALAVPSVVLAQEEPESGQYQPLTPEEAFEKWGVPEDPGPDPDPETIWLRSGQEYRIEKYDKQQAVFDKQPEGWVRPFRMVNYSAEIYRQDDQWVWVWMPVLKDPERPAHLQTSPEEYSVRDLRPAQIEYLEWMKREFVEMPIAQSEETVVFADSSNGLPKVGSWRNSLDVADMNGDGHLDIVTPPQRGGVASIMPSIFLGDGKGNWTYWADVEWPRGLNYGAVAAGDFNGDGHQDLAFAYHLGGIAVFLGDGKGKFIDASEGLPDYFPTRKVVVADFDADGRLDLAAISEGPVMHDQKRLNHGKIRVYRNADKGRRWELIEVVDVKEEVAGDWLGVGDFNGDRYPDLISSSIFFNRKNILHLSEGRGKWAKMGEGFIPGFSYHMGLTTGKFTGGKRDDAAIAFTRTWPREINPLEVEHPELTGVAGIDLLTFSGKEPKRIPVVRFPRKEAIWAMSSGDFNGDGKRDIVYASGQPRTLVIYLGDGKGGFRQARLEGAELPPNRSYDIHVADVDRDGRDDILMMFEASGNMGPKDGSIRVFLNQTPGAVKAKRR